MPVYNPTIAELIRDGNVNLLAHCENCRFVVVIPFRKVLRGRMPWRVRLGQIVPRLRCSKCGNPPRSVDVQKKQTHAAYGHSQ
jgi:uncharacterized Zn finger protein